MTELSTTPKDDVRSKIVAAMNPHGWLGDQCVTDIIAALATTPPATVEAQREAIARKCYVPDRVALGPVEDAFKFAAKHPKSATGRCVSEAYERAEAILATLPPAPVEGSGK